MDVRVVDNSDQFKKAMAEAVLRALETCGLVAEGYAKKLCPVDMGLLRNSITHALSGEAPAITEYESTKKDKTGAKKRGSYSGEAPGSKVPCVYIGTNVEYAAYVELGTSRQIAQPYLKPAVADHAKKYAQIIKNAGKSG